MKKIKQKWYSYININIELKKRRSAINKEGHFIMMKKLIQWENITVISVYSPNKIFLKNI